MGFLRSAFLLKLFTFVSVSLSATLLLSGCGGESKPYAHGNKEKPILTANFEWGFTSEFDVNLKLSSTVTSSVMILALSQAECETELANYFPFYPTIPLTLTTPNTSTSIWVKVRSSARVWSDCVQATVVHDDLDPVATQNVQFQDAASNLNASPIITWSNGTDIGLAGIDFYQAELKSYDLASNDYISVTTSLTATSGSPVNMSNLTLSSNLDYTFNITPFDRAGNKGPETLSSSSFSAGGTLHHISEPSQNYFSATVAVGDLNGDGSADLVSADFGTNEFFIHYNLTDNIPNFTAVSVAQSHGGIQDIVIGDVDGDGDNDIVYASLYSDQVIWLQSSGGATPTFTEIPIPGVLLGAKALKLADVNNDGHLDIVAGGSYDDRLVWYEHDGTLAPGTPSFTQNVIYSDAYFLNDIAVADLDADGDIDIIVSSEGDDTLAWFENDGTATFTRHVISTTESHIRGVDVGDFNQDGHLDIVSASWFSSTLRLHLSDGAANFTSSDIDTLSQIQNVIVGDMDGDGIDDIVAVSSSGSMRLYTCDGVAPTFTASYITDRTKAEVVELVDIDGDGDLDIVSLKSGLPTLIEREPL